MLLLAFLEIYCKKSKLDAAEMKDQNCERLRLKNMGTTQGVPP